MEEGEGVGVGEGVGAEALDPLGSVRLPHHPVSAVTLGCLDPGLSGLEAGMRWTWTWTGRGRLLGRGRAGPPCIAACHLSRGCRYGMPPLSPSRAAALRA